MSSYNEDAKSKLERIIYQVKKDFPEFSLKIKSIDIDSNIPLYNCEIHDEGTLKDLEWKIRSHPKFLGMPENHIRNLFGHEFSEILAVNNSFLIRKLLANSFRIKFRSYDSRYYIRHFPGLGYLANKYIHIKTDEIATSRGYLNTRALLKKS